MSRKKILVPIDVNQDNSELLRYAGNMANLLHGRISCVSFIPESVIKLSASKELKYRRELEFKLAKITSDIFSHEKPEYDIIVSKGNIENRILNMVNDLEIDLMITHVANYKSIEEITAKIGIPIVAIKGNNVGLKELVLPIDLDSPYCHKLNESIELPNLLNCNLKIIIIAAKSLSTNRFKEGVKEINAILKKENFTYAFRIMKHNDNYKSILHNLLKEDSYDTLILTHNEFRSLLEDYFENAPSAFGIIIIPEESLNKPIMPTTKTFCYN